MVATAVITANRISAYTLVYKVAQLTSGQLKLVAYFIVRGQMCRPQPLSKRRGLLGRPNLKETIDIE